MTTETKREFIERVDGSTTRWRFGDAVILEKITETSRSFKKSELRLEEGEWPSDADLLWLVDTGDRPARHFGGAVHSSFGPSSQCVSKIVRVDTD